MKSTFETNIAPTIPKTGLVGSLLFFPESLIYDRHCEAGKRTKGIYRRSFQNFPLVTIITVCFDAGKTIQQCINSVASQTYPNIEYLIIDGGSTDETLKILKQNAENIDYYVSERDAGLYDAMNKGLALATGEYILILNADDWYQPDAVEVLLRNKLISDYDVVAADAVQIDGSGNKKSVMRRIPFDASTHLRMTLRHETMLIPKDIYERIGVYSKNFKILSDWEFAIRILNRGISVLQLEYTALNFRVTGLSNNEANRLRLIEERKLLLARQFPFLSRDDQDLLASRDKHDVDVLKKVSGNYCDAILTTSLEQYAAEMVASGLWEGSQKTDASDFFLLSDLKKPAVSVIVPFFNSEDTIGCCLESVLKQESVDLEVVCVNDQSADSSELIVREFAAKDKRVKIIHNENNIGHGGSRNVGVKHSFGKYIFNLDPDDTIPKKALFNLLRTGKSHNSDMIRGAYLKQQAFLGKSTHKPQRISLSLKREPIRNTNLAETPELLTGLATVEGHWCYLYKREIAVNSPWPTDFKMGQDAVFLVKALVLAKRVTVTDYFVYYYNTNLKSAMNRFTLDKYLDVLRWRRKAYHQLSRNGYSHIGEFFLLDYFKSFWHRGFLDFYKINPSYAALCEVSGSIVSAISECQLNISMVKNRILENKDTEVSTVMQFLVSGEVVCAEEALLKNEPQILVSVDGNASAKSTCAGNKETDIQFWKNCTAALMARRESDFDRAVNHLKKARATISLSKNFTKKKQFLERLTNYVRGQTSNEKQLPEWLLSPEYGAYLAFDLDCAGKKDLNNSKKTDFGIALYGHSRKSFLKHTLESLRRQDALQFTEVWIDGDQGKREVMEKVRLVNELKDKYEVKSWHQQRANFGFRKMILVSLFEMCERYDKILVLEDDCFPTRDAVRIFRKELEALSDNKDIFSIYGHHFLVQNETPRFGRFQGWGWGTTSDKLLPLLQQLVYLYSMSEEKYLRFVENALTPELLARINVTPGRQPTDTLHKFFAWDETLCLLCAINGMWHKPTSERVIYNFGMGVESTHFGNNPRFRKPPFNLISEDEVWSFF